MPNPSWGLICPEVVDQTEMYNPKEALAPRTTTLTTILETMKERIAALSKGKKKMAPP